MANEKTLEILKEIKADPKAKELFKGMEKPKSPDEAIAAYAQVAEKLGYGITAEDIREAVKQEETIRKAKRKMMIWEMLQVEGPLIVKNFFFVFMGTRCSQTERCTPLIVTNFFFVLMEHSCN